MNKQVKRLGTIESEASNDIVLPFIKRRSRNSFRESQNQSEVKPPTESQKTKDIHLFEQVEQEENNLPSVTITKADEVVDKLKRLYHRKTTERNRRSSFLIDVENQSHIKTTRGRNIHNQFTKLLIKENPIKLFNTQSNLQTISNHVYSIENTEEETVRKLSFRKQTSFKPTHSVSKEKLCIDRKSKSDKKMRNPNFNKVIRMLRKKTLVINKSEKRRKTRYDNLNFQTITSFTLDKKNKPKDLSFDLISEGSSNSLFSEYAVDETGLLKRELKKTTVEVVTIIDNKKVEQIRKSIDSFFQKIKDPKVNPNNSRSNISSIRYRLSDNNAVQALFSDEIYELCKNRIERIKMDILSPDNLADWHPEDPKIRRIIETNTGKYQKSKEKFMRQLREDPTYTHFDLRDEIMYSEKKEIYLALNERLDEKFKNFGTFNKKHEFKEAYIYWLAMKLQLSNDNKFGVKFHKTNINYRNFLNPAIINEFLPEYMKNRAKDFSVPPEKIVASPENCLISNFNNSQRSVPKPKIRKRNKDRMLELSDNDTLFVSLAYKTHQTEESDSSSEYVEEFHSPKRRKFNYSVNNYFSDSLYITSSLPSSAY